MGILCIVLRVRPQCTKCVRACPTLACLPSQAPHARANLAHRQHESPAAAVRSHRGGPPAGASHALLANPGRITTTPNVTSHLR